MQDNQASDQEGKGLSFQLAEKHDILVVSLIGKICKVTGEILHQCTEEIARSPARSVVLNFLGVVEIDQPGIQGFTKLQVLVRRKPAELRVCFIKPAIAAFLHEAGVLRPEEMSQDLKGAIVSASFKRSA